MPEKIFLNVIAGSVIVFKWLAIVLAPTLALGIVGLIICDIREQMDLNLIYILMGLGAVSGVILAENIRRKYGLIEFVTLFLPPFLARYSALSAALNTS